MPTAQGGFTSQQHIAYSVTCSRYPIIMDAMASEVQRKGDAFMAKWAEVMTCMQPKTYFFRPDVALQLGWAITREVIEQKVFGKADNYQLKA